MSCNLRAFLKRGYKVIFFHKKGSIRPFEVKCAEGLISVKEGELHIEKNHAEYSSFVKNLENKKQYSDHLLELEFESVFSYLYGLHALAGILQEFVTAHKRTAAIYLAAAVSDFYVPLNEMSEHKIQSRDEQGGSSSKGGFAIYLQNTPKFLYNCLTKTCDPSHMFESQDDIIQARNRHWHII